mgnify:CR=1 FL=1
MSDAPGTGGPPPPHRFGTGEPFSVDLSWERLDPTSRWFGAIHYTGSDEHTFVTIN